MNLFLMEKDLLKLVLALLDYSEGLDLSALLSKRKLKPVFFYLVIGDLNPELFTTDQFSAILDQLSEIVLFFKNHTWFKLIITAIDITQSQLLSLKTL